MKPTARAGKKTPFDADMSSNNRQEKILRQFKEVLHQLVFMLWKASEVDTVYLYWINRERQQFVLETKATDDGGAVFQDRVGFDDHFLNAWKGISQPEVLKVGADVAPETVNHHRGNPPVEYITLLPFCNNDETVALTALESEQPLSGRHSSSVFDAYTAALRNVLNTYLEVTDLYKQQQEWVNYEASLQFLNDKGHHAGLLEAMLNTLQALLDNGSVSFASRGMGQWVNVMNARKGPDPLPVGLPLKGRSLAKSVLESHEREFAIHFNQTPKKMSARERHTEGATLAIPMLFDEALKGIVLANDENPLVFSESTKHKLQNAVHLTALKIQTKCKKSSLAEPLLSNEFGAIIPDGWERLLDAQIGRLQSTMHTFHSWAGLVTPSQMARIRTRFRLEQLHSMQEDLVRMINPNAFGISGVVGFYSDYIYLVFLQSKDPQARQHWTDAVKQKFGQPVALSSGEQIETGLNMSFKKLEAADKDSYQLISELKRGL